jgi:hypothetical protein
LNTPRLQRKRFSPTPLQGATPAAWQSQFCGVSGRMVYHLPWRLYKN